MDRYRAAGEHAPWVAVQLTPRDLAVGEIAPTIRLNLAPVLTLLAAVWPAQSATPSVPARLELGTQATYNVGTLNGGLPAAASGGVGVPFTEQFDNSHHLRERSK